MGSNLPKAEIKIRQAPKSEYPIFVKNIGNHTQTDYFCSLTAVN